MRANKVRNGEKFVVEDRGGVWQKLGTDPAGLVKARCVFGKKEVFGTETAVDSSAFVYVLFDGKEPVSEGIKIAVGDEDTDEVLLEIKDASPAQIAVFSSVETLLLRPPYKRKLREYAVVETALCPEENTLYVMVRNPIVTDKEDKEDKDDKKDDKFDDVQSIAGNQATVEAGGDRVCLDEPTLFVREVQEAAK